VAYFIAILLLQENPLLAQRLDLGLLSLLDERGLGRARGLAGWAARREKKRRLVRF
jgi:hypothetical protein